MKTARLAVVETAHQQLDPKAAIVDEYGELDRQVQEFEPKRKRHEALKSQIKSWYDDHPAEAEATAEGRLFRVQISARENESVIAKARAYKELGKERFLKVCSLTIKALKEALGEAGASALITKAPTGSRKLKVVAKAAPGPVPVSDAA